MNKSHATYQLALVNQMMRSPSGARVEVRLQRALEVGGKRIDVLFLRAPTEPEVQQVLKHQDSAAQLTSLLKIVTALPTAAIERMGVRDFMACADALTDLCNRRAEVFNLVAKDVAASSKG